MEPLELPVVFGEVTVKSLDAWLKPTNPF